ncbi:MAG: KH domain-containing protein [Acholeplasmataceae bacterium]|nr:KH domain-containing protein [Acholeplasmataceae bacterium]
MAIDFENLIKSIVVPLVHHPEDVLVKTLSAESGELTIQVLVNEEDLGRVIGKGGRIASAIRTIVYAGASKEGKHVRIDIDAF